MAGSNERVRKLIGELKDLSDVELEEVKWLVDTVYENRVKSRAPVQNPNPGAAPVAAGPATNAIGTSRSSVIPITHAATTQGNVERQALSTEGTNSQSTTVRLNPEQDAANSSKSSRLKRRRRVVESEDNADDIQLPEADAQDSTRPQDSASPQQSANPLSESSSEQRPGRHVPQPVTYFPKICKATGTWDWRFK